MFTILCFLAYLLITSLGSEASSALRVCGETYDLCSPAGASTSNLPPVGLELSNLYPDLVQAINSEGTAELKSSAGSDLPTKKRIEDTFCCAQTSQCLLLPSYNIPFCWDRFTTNYYFPDGSYGSIVAGNFTSSSGTQVNLIYGDWENQSGMKGNIYSNIPTMMPDTSTLPMPTPWTSTGAGSAIPASELGTSAASPVLTTNVSMTTISAITLQSTTISVGTSACGHCNISIISGLTGLPSTGTVFTSGSAVPITTTTMNGTAGTSMPSTGDGSRNATGVIVPSIVRGSAALIGPVGTKFLVLTINLFIWAIMD